MPEVLKDIFLRDIERPIEGVIKADDEANLKNELEEYELIPEVAKRLEVFLDAYNNYTNANGVWLSGFFGCGKSHLLKMLSLVLENREVDGTRAADIFLPKCQKENDILHGDMKRALEIPSKSILFNIDQKADVISKNQTDALIAVFIKVFDESCGYYGKQPYIAKFERELDQENLLASFREHFQRLSKRDWDWGRARPTRVASFVDEAYKEVTGQAVSGVLDKYRADYKLSIEDFAEQINDYIKQQPPGFRLNFFVDEVGQYIAKRTNLMTNLQTVAESLATKCRGQAWIIVTAQEEIDSIIGDLPQSDSEADGFSKIQARFKHRMKLTSADAAEVIQLRLLMKDENGINLLSDTYHQQSNNFKTLFGFTDGAQTYRNFKDKEHFIHCYPFIPYQFNLFQSAIQNLSKHNAFEGKHSSVGERSMLGVFQDVAKMVGDKEIGQLATFDLMFEGLRTALKSTVQTAVNFAEQNLENKFAVQLLKALFLVKYVKEFKSTPRNLCVLMLDSFDKNIGDLQKEVEEGLNLLEQQTLVQRNGDVYEYLTDEEKDVEQEIKNTEVDSRKVADELEKLAFDSVIKQRKIRFEDNGQDFIYSRKLDEKLHGREHELAIHIISPFHENCGNLEILRMQSMGRDELLVVMPSDDLLVRDLVMYQKTVKYIQHATSQQPKDAIKRIIAEKGQANQERYADIKRKVSALLGKSDLIISASDVEINSDDGQTKIIKGFQALIKRVYPNLAMLRDVSYQEQDIAVILERVQQDILAAGSLPETEQEMLGFINNNKKTGIRTTVKVLLEKFERKPYGWYYAAVLCTLASLCARGKIEVRIDGNIQEDSDLAAALRNTHGHNNVVLEPQIDFSASQIRALKEFHADFFDTQPDASEAKALGNETSSAMDELRQELEKLYAQGKAYPFLYQLKPVIDKLGEYKGKPYTWFLTELKNDEDDLLGLKDDLIEPIRRFMAGSQKTIYDAAQAFAQSQEQNFSYIDGPEIKTVLDSLNDKDCFKGNRMQQLKGSLDALKARVEEQLNAEIDAARTAIEGKKGMFCALEEFSKITEEQQQQLTQAFNIASTSVANQTLIALVRDKLRSFEDTEYSRLLSQLMTLATPQEPEEPEGSEQQQGGNEESDTGSGGASHNEGSGESGKVKPAPKPKPKVKIVPSSQIKVRFDKPLLSDESDVDRYLTAMREALVAQINDGNKVQV